MKTYRFKNSPTGQSSETLAEREITIKNQSKTQEKVQNRNL